MCRLSWSSLYELDRLISDCVVRERLLPRGEPNLPIQAELHPHGIQPEWTTSQNPRQGCYIPKPTVAAQRRNAKKQIRIEPRRRSSVRAKVALSDQGGALRLRCIYLQFRKLPPLNHEFRDMRPRHQSQALGATRIGMCLPAKSADCTNSVHTDRSPDDQL